MSPAKLIEALGVESKHGAYYTGGNVEWHDDHLYCQTATAISKIEIETGKVISNIGEDTSEDADTIQTFTSDGGKFVTSHRSGLFKLWNSDGELEKSWKYIHKGPVASVRLKGDRLISGGSDGVVRDWNLLHHACVQSFKDCSGVVSVVEFEPEGEGVFASGDDGKICYLNGKEAVVYNGHFSKVTSIAFCSDGEHFISSGRDRVLILWEFGKAAAVKTLPVYEGVESVLALPQKFKIADLNLSADGIYAASGGESGIVHVWDIKASKLIYKQTNSLVSKAKEEGGLAITKLLFDKTRKTIGVVSVEQNIILHQLKSFAVIKQLIGFSDEILDVIFAGVNDSYIAVATNSNDVKLYERATMNCQLLKAHTDIVLALSKADFDPNLIASSSKDKTVRLWMINDGSAECVGIGLRHTGSIASVAFGHASRFVVSVSQDTCLKMWEIPEKPTSNANLICTHTEVAHQKEINSVAVSPNDKIIATGSQDKTAKLWSENLTLLGVLKGHRRGVWCVRFSPIDQVLLTSSADCTIKMWSIAELNCLKTIEGHESSVIRAEFISKGMQILSTGGDGLLKLFNLKTSECVTTLDEHESRIWTLAVSKDESKFITGGSDSNLMMWKDFTEEKRLEKEQELEKLALEQQLSNYIHNDELLKALRLALKLNKPHQVLKIVNAVIKKGDSGLTAAVHDLRDEQKEELMKCAIEWNTNSRNCQAAQLVLNILINELQSGEFRPMGLRSWIEGALPYTERHFKRITQMMQDLQFITYTINCMQPHAKT